MSAGLVRTLLAQHLAAGVLPAGDQPSDAELTLRVDHLVLGGRAGLLALRTFISASGMPSAIDIALAGPDRGAGPWTVETAEELADLHEAARRAGVPFSRAGHGRSDLVHRERHAAPGRLVLVAGDRVPASGALGALALRADPIEASAALASGICHVGFPGITHLVLEGVCAPAVGGTDVGLALAAAHGERIRDRFVEVAGDLALYPLTDRLALALTLAELGARASIFPSDERTRAHLRAEDRESEWKVFAGAEPPADAIRLDVAALEPMVAPLERPGGARRVRDVPELRIGLVEIGVEATYGDLARIAACLSGRRVAAGVSLLIVPGTRQVMETARETGVLDQLVAGGARVMDAGARLAAHPGGVGADAGLCFGVRREDALPLRGRWYSAGAETCAASAISGAVADPRMLGMTRPVSDEPDRYVVTSDWIQRPAALAMAPEAAASPGREPAVPEGPVRGVVLLVLGHGVGAQQILPLGARLRARFSDPPSLAPYVFQPVDPTFAGRAVGHGGGVIIAGSGFGNGETRDPAALALRALGVRVVLAQSIAPDWRRQLLNAGILPLCLTGREGDAVAQAGDELEFPGVPDALAPGEAVVIRNLTRATQTAVQHDLSERQIDTFMAGGLVAEAILMRGAVRA